MGIYIGDLIHVRANSTDKKVVDPACPTLAEVVKIDFISDTGKHMNNALKRYVLLAADRIYYAYAYHQEQEFYRVDLISK